MRNLSSQLDKEPEPFRLAEAEEWEAVLAHVRKGFPVNRRDSGGRTLLMVAALDGNLPICRQLLGLRANIDALDKENWTPLTHAAFGGRSETVLFFVERRCRVRSPGGYVALYHAAGKCSPEAVSTLLQHGALHVLGETERKETPLHEAVDRNRYDNTLILLRHGVNVNPVNEFGWTPLYGAIRDDRLKILKLLVDHGADVNYRQGTPDSPVGRALKDKQFAVVEFLRSHGARD